ncbi:hypothetical protein [Haloactinomyces albus]|uniref:Uncharacterized protein n=1 Tax=Haloactinomyces albus TaxID=1352928 RepID=A0AAE4CPJ2_9ACTN|nr:hypothetical protein [Haloactinomyces albus]MDR7303132.1 hypothetical protein [Haloactinomyces albus]
MITRIAVVPYPPLLVPELTVRASAETERLRQACLRAVSSLTDSARTWVAVGVNRGDPRLLEPHCAGTFAGYGVDVTVALDASATDTSAPDPLLPLPALVAGWLREQSGAEQVTAHLLAADTPPEDSRAFGARLRTPGDRGGVGETGDFGLLILAEGAVYTVGAQPAEGVEQLDEQVRRALADVDPAALLGLDTERCHHAGMEGRAALQALAGAVEPEPGAWSGDLLYSAAPYGVSYHVAVWSRSDARSR